MNDIANRLNVKLLCPLVQEMLEEATILNESLEEGESVSISAYPDFVLNFADGHWAGIDRKIRKLEKSVSYVIWRGSLYAGRSDCCSLEDALDTARGTRLALTQDESKARSAESLGLGA